MEQLWFGLWFEHDGECCAWSGGCQDPKQDPGGLNAVHKMKLQVLGNIEGPLDHLGLCVAECTQHMEQRVKND